MKNVFLGEYVKQRRLDLGLTQEQLCDGICEPMTFPAGKWETDPQPQPDQCPFAASGPAG
jgi:hypothetical protein